MSSAAAHGDRPSGPGEFFRSLVAVVGRSIVELAFPSLCIVCDAPRPPDDRWLCGSCRALLGENHTNRDPCPRCCLNRKIDECTCEIIWDHPFERVYSLFDYDDRVKVLMREIKYRGKAALAFHLGKYYAGTVPESFVEGVDAFVPVPLHFRRALKRGYNQAAHFARGVVEGRGGEVELIRPLRRRRNTRTQTKLDKSHRVANLAGAFTVPRNRTDQVRGKRLMLVDDVVTTGATTAQCTEALLSAGAEWVRVLSLARD